MRIRSAGAAVLSLSLTCIAQAPGVSPLNPWPAQSQTPKQAPQDQIQGDDRILQALDRFTFGPRPGDVQAVRAMGLENWFQAQLHPDQLDETALNARLTQFPAMQWTTEELFYLLPSNVTIRQAIQGRAVVPENGVLHAVYANQMARLQAKQREQAAANAGMETTAAPPPIDTMEQDPGPQTTPDFAAIVELPPAQRVVTLARMSQPELAIFLRSLAPPQRRELVDGLTPEQKQTVQSLQNPQGTLINELIDDRLARDVYSSAQLQEVMTDFWLNHFNVFLYKTETMPYFLVSYERDTIRPHALGKFEDLLEATAHSPAMLLYLDNAKSLGPDSRAAERAKLNAAQHPNQPPEGINENYGRELMELHTVGVNGGYTQADVIQAARILTGWTFTPQRQGGDFLFNANRHEPGTETVMGHKFRSDGEQQGRDLLHFLATRPATAQFICHELAVRFVSDDPPQSLVDRMASAWAQSDGDIAAVLTAMFHSPEFWSKDAYQAKVKTPLEYVVSAVRASDADVENFAPLANALRKMGMPVYGCVPPNGYSSDSAPWLNAGAMVDRMNFALALAANRLPGVRVDWPALTQNASSPQASEALLERALLPGGVSAATRSEILEQLRQRGSAEMKEATATQIDDEIGSRAGRGEGADAWLAGLLLGSPAFQRR